MNALCCFALVICAACVCRGVVEVVALLGSVQRGLCGSSTVRISLAQPRAAISAQRGVILSLNIDIALLNDELKCSLYA